MKKWTLLAIAFSFFLITLAPNTGYSALCRVGDGAKVLWGGKWWPATVISVNGAGTRCKIHYKGYGKKWDEWVGPSRIRVAGKATTSSGYHVDQRIKVLWNGKWWSARILKKDGGRYYIKYDGYGSKWNEWVTTARMKRR